ncbi:hypothetical protein [Cellulosimicrobium cellulans]|uniref:hypothetical protein n=1 Tax=Cellulosimicrobium cellulans TaxID=1710 RepID=UPI00130E5005|nr:hypothetical protein [Cellulosimicrobium cellulans]
MRTSRLTSAHGGPHAAARAAAWVLALALALGGASALAAPAPDAGTGTGAAGGPAGGAEPSAAEPVFPAGSGTAAVVGTGASGSGAVRAQWDGPTTHLDWTGRRYATAEATFVGDRVAVPGDQAQRTLHLANAGPGGAVMTVSLLLTDVTPAAPAGGVADAVELVWDVAGVAGRERLATLRGPGGRVAVAQVRVPRGQTAAVTVGFAVPAEVSAAGGDEPVLQFDVEARLQGETGPEDVPALAVTGTHLLGALAVALGLLAAGCLARSAARRRPRCGVCGAVVDDRPRGRPDDPAGADAPLPCGRCGWPVGAVLVAEAGR